MSFNLDDPLAGILSDGSDDSFFDDDILGKKKPAKKKTTPIAEKKSAIFDLEVDKPKASSSISDAKKESLFDLGGDSKKADKIPLPIQSPAPMKRTLSKDSFTIPLVEKPKVDITKSPAKQKISASTDKLDILNEFSQDKKDGGKILEKGKSSQSILDDLLGSSSKPPGSSQSAKPAAKNQDFDFDSFLGNTTKPASKAVSKSTKSDAVKEENKSKEDLGKKKGGGDWLGIFQDKDEILDEGDSDMPSWLVGEKDSKKKKSEKKEVPKQEAKQPDRVEIETQNVQQREVTVHSIVDQIVMPKTPMNILQGSNEDLTTESAALYLQQQESQLMVAMQLKAQEERLVALQTRQKESQRVQREAAHAHHAQLDAMLQRQSEQRQQMQAIIGAHQQRISERIKELLGTNTYEYNDNTEDTGAPNNDIEINRNERDSPYSREKKQLLQLVQSLQENHDKEIDLMETSYRRQLVFLEVTQTHAEERMKEETEKLVKFYSEKIQWLEEHHQLYKTMAEENLGSLTERHKAETEMIRQQHLENIKVLQEHHTALMENIKNAVKQEQALIQDSATFSVELHELVTDVKESKTQCKQLVDKVDKIVENTQRDYEKSLQSRELSVNEMLQQLKREREQFDIEKAENRDIVKMLETRLKQMTTMIEEETVSLKQKRMEFEFEKATFGKQTEFAKTVLKKQEEEIKTMREEIQREYQEKTSRIEEERSKTLKDSSSVAKEKASIQNLKQDLEKMKAELQGQLEEVTEERSKLSVEKQQLQLEEQRLLSKSRDYDLLAKTTIDKQSQADKKYSEAEFLQRKYEERIRRIQEHAVSINAREKQIAKEKVALSRERLNLHNEKKQIEGRPQCSLCKTQSVPQYMPSYNIPPSFMPVSRDYRNVDEAMSNIERELGSMSRNYNSLRQSTEGATVSEVKYQSGETAAMDTDSFKFQELMDPKFMMLRLDVQKVLSNLDQSKKVTNENTEEHDENRLDE